MRTRRSPRNQERLWKALGKEGPRLRLGYKPHYHTDDSGTFECPVSSICNRKAGKP